MKMLPILIAIFLSSQVRSQRLIESSGTVSFFSEAPLENIEAANHQVLAVIDQQTGEVAVSMLMTGFKFQKALMEEHFNENYVESFRYPKATFEGKIKDYSIEMLKKENAKVTVEGELVLHGEKQSITIEVNLKSSNGLLEANTAFPIKLADYKIKIPGIVSKNIAEVVEVKAKLQFNTTSP